MKLPAVSLAALTLVALVCGGAYGAIATHTHTAPRTHARAHRRPARGFSVRFAGPVPAHLTDADYLWYGNEPANDPHIYAPYLTYAYPKGDKYKTVHNAGMLTVLYTNPMMPQTNEQPMHGWLGPGGIWNNSAATDCLGHMITDYAGAGWLANMLTTQSTPAYVAASEQQYIVSAAGNNGGDYVDTFFMDNSNDVYGVSAQPCNWSAAKWTAGFIAATAGLTKPTFANALSVPEAYQNPPPGVTPANQVASLASVTGGVYEGCYGVHGGIATGSLWQKILQTELLTAQAFKVFWCYADDTTAASSATANRLFVYASFVLAFNPDPGAYIYETAYGSPDYFKVFPEFQFYPTQPAIDPTNPQTVNATYLQSGGAYQNSFAACYYAGQSIGGCQVDVNPGSANATVTPNPALSCMVTLAGNDVLGGGTLTMDTAANYTLAPGTAAMYVGCRTPSTRRKHGNA